MSIYSNIDIETFKWVRGEVESSLQSANDELQKYVASDDKSDLYGLSNLLHQVVGSLQMLELKSLSALLMESELLVEDFQSDETKVGKPTFVVMLDSAFKALSATFDRIESGLPENPTDVVELINQIRATRGLQGIEISSLFSPMIEVFPEVNAERALKDQDYIQRAKALRAHFQGFLLNWLRGNDETAIDKITLVFDKLLQMSTFGSVARLWWVATAYADFIKHNDLGNKSVHGRIFRQIDDKFRELEMQGESALVRDPGDELIKIMLFYIGVGEKRTERMDEIVDAFKLQEYFPALKVQDASNLESLETELEALKSSAELPLPVIRQLVTAYFETDEQSNAALHEILEQLESVETQANKHETGIVGEVIVEATNTVRNMRRGLVASDDDSGFHLAAALMFVENSIAHPEEVDHHWLQNGQLKLRALQALNNQEELSEDLDGAHLTGSERKALLDVVGNEVEENLKSIEDKLEAFGDNQDSTVLEGIDGKIRQVRGALQVLGEQKVGLLLKMAEEQFTGLQSGEVEATPDLVEALAISIGTMEEYVRGLQNERGGMDHLLDRSITDLEVAIGKKVSRDDVEDLIDNASDSLFSWLGNQSDFDLFTKLKSSLRDLNILARKTKLQEVQHLVKEQDRLVDVISQEPAFLTDNITANLQNNMASIAEQIITLYGTEETQEERELEAELARKKSAIEADDADAVRIHDAMDIEELDQDIVEEIQSAEEVSSTELAKQHAAEQAQIREVDPAIFEAFLEESAEVLTEANIQYEICKADHNDRDAIRELRRAFHTLKGSSRMVALDSIGEVAWFSESLFNYVLDTEKPLTPEIISFARAALDEFQGQLKDQYANQHTIDVAAWGQKTEEVNAASRDGSSIATQNLVATPETKAAPETEAAPEAVVEPEVAADSVTAKQDAPTVLDAPDEAESESLAAQTDETISDLSQDRDFEIDFNDMELEAIDTDTDVKTSDVGEYLEAASNAELADILDASDEVSFIEFASEMTVEDDSVIELSDELFETSEDTDGEVVEDELEPPSFNLIDDPEMRTTFIQEALSNLEKVDKELKRDPLLIEEDDPLSIALHTLLGNVRTLGIDHLANALDCAEHLCMAKLESGSPFNQQETDTLQKLSLSMREGIDTASNEAPYFEWNSEQWMAYSQALEALVQAAQLVAPAIEAPESELLVDTGEEFVEVDSADDIEVIELDGESVSIMEIDGDDIDLELIEPVESEVLTFDDELLVDETDADVSVEEESNTIEPQSDADRVAAVFNNLDSIDDLVESDEPAPFDLDTEVLVDSSDDLDDIEASLLALKDDSADQIDELELEEVRPSKDVNESLIPDDLTNLLEDDLLDIQPENIASVESAETAVIEELVVEEPGAEEPVVEEPVAEEPVAEEPVAEEPVAEEPVAEEPVVEEPVVEEPVVEEPVVEEPVVEEPVVEEPVVEEPVVEEPVVEEPVVEEPVAEEPVAEEPVAEEPVVEVEADDDEPEEILPDDDVSLELRGIFVEELRSLHHELDDEVAKLANFGEMAPAMANILRHLHTIKGSSLMAEANALGELTHHTESFLESNFIRNEDDLKSVRNTLEQYVDALDHAADRYTHNKGFRAPKELLSILGVESQSPQASGTTQAIVETTPLVVPEPVEPSIDYALIEEKLADITQQMQVLNGAWKSARGWNKVQPQMSEQFTQLHNVLELGGESLADISPLANRAHSYIDDLGLTKSGEFKQAKALLQETFDTIVSDTRSLMNEKSISEHSELMERLAKSPVDETATDPLAQAKTVQASVFVPGSVELSAVEQADKDRQEAAARERAAALRIRTDTLDSLTNFVGDASMNRSQMREEVIAIKSVVEELYSNVQRFNSQLRELEIEADAKITSRTNESIGTSRGDEFDPLELDRYTKLQQLSRGLAENLDELGGIQNTLSNFVYRAETSLQKQERLNRELQDEIMQVRLVSFGGVGPQLRQVARRTARELNKEVDLVIEGADVRLDKAILDGVVPALEHMIRNAVDHGIELPKDRKAKGKPKSGKITAECRQVAREIIISVRDDGVGLDLEKIRSKAIADNLLAEDQDLNPEDMLMYISQSGFSTADKLTQISGRGVGMDVVQTTLRRMSGSIAYDLENDQQGSHFIIRLPISLAVTSAMFVEAGDTQFAIAARTIERVVNIEAEELIGYLKADKPRLDVSGQSYSLIDLAEYLGYDSKLPMLTGKLSVILVTAGVQNIAVIVEKLFDTQEIVVKNLGDHLGRIPIYAGATIRADGSVVLLLDLVGISYYESFVAIPDQNVGVSQTIPTVMVVDDSLTVRKSAERDITGLGINSVLAKDGLDAQVQLRQEAPDMILLDIEMPRMDGFELLEWVKSNDDLKHVPVVMISSRATEKYIQKATELGCTAFLGKPYLLENLVQVFNEHLPLEAPIELT